MATELKDYIKVYDDAFTGEFCREVIRAYDLDLLHQNYIDREKRPTFTELNITERFLEKDERWVDIQNTLQKTFVEYVNLYMKDLDIGQDFPAKYAFEQFRIKKYSTANDEFRDHVDVQDFTSARRFLVCFLYLKDVTEGGQTAFPKLDHAIQPKCGRLLMFPSVWLYRHAGRPVTRGTKYIVGSYLHYL